MKSNDKLSSYDSEKLSRTLSRKFQKKNMSLYSTKTRYSYWRQLQTKKNKGNTRKNGDYISWVLIW